MQKSTKDVLVKLSILLLLCEYASCLIIPEELPTILSLIYSNIPPIKKGTDSRVGIGFRLGEHADFQVLMELGPQTDTASIGTADSKRRRDAMLSAAMRGELGPLAQAVAKYQMERKLQRELERLRAMEEKLKKIGVEGTGEKQTAASEWLSAWSKDMIQSPEEQILVRDASIEKDLPTVTENKTIQQRIGRPSASGTNGKDKISDLAKLYKLQTEKKEKQ